MNKVEQQEAFLRRQSPSRPVRMRCLRCARVGYYGRGAIACQQLVGLLGTYRCPGRVVRAPIIRRQKEPPIQVPKGHGLGFMLTEEGQKMSVDAERAETTKKWNVARTKVDSWSDKLKVATENLRKWQQKKKRLEVEMALTDTDWLALKEKRRAAFHKGREPKGRGRGMKIGGGGIE